MMRRFLASLGIFTAAAAHANVCCEEPNPGPFAFNYPASQDLACPENFYVYAEGLAFQAKQEDMEFAAFVPESSSRNTLTGEFVGFDDDHHNWKYQPGMRFGVGSYFHHDDWNFQGNWTWLHVTDYKTVRPPNSGILPFWYFGGAELGPGSAPKTFTATSVWDASYNVLDLRLGKPYHLSRSVQCLLHAGARLGWINQHLSQRYGFRVNDGNNNPINPIMHGDSNFWCAGGRIGLDTDWAVGKGWSLFVNFSGSMLAGKFLIKQKSDPQRSGDGFINIQRHMHANTLNFESAFGLSWKQRFLSNKYLVSLHAAYEFIQWFDQLNLRRFFNSGNNASDPETVAYPNNMINRGTLTLNGFSLRLQLDI